MHERQPDGLQLSRTWLVRLARLLLAIGALCISAVLLALTITGLFQVIAVIANGYITWQLAVWALITAATGAGTFLFGRAFLREVKAAIAPAPARDRGRSKDGVRRNGDREAKDRPA